MDEEQASADERWLFAVVITHFRYYHYCKDKNVDIFQKLLIIANDSMYQSINKNATQKFQNGKSVVVTKLNLDKCVISKNVPTIKLAILFYLTSY